MNRPRVPLPFPRDQSERIAWLNSSGEAIPAFACVKLFSYDDATNQFQADKPDGSEGLYYANGPAIVATDKYSGSACWNLPRRCLLDATTYEVGDQVGPVSGQWGMGSEGKGWRVLRPPNADKEAVVQMVGGGGSVNIVHGIVSEDHGRGYYTIELSEWIGHVQEKEDDLCPKDDGASSLSSSSIGEGCTDVVLPMFRGQTRGIGEFVLAYDPQSTIVPLEIGTDCVMVDNGDSALVDDSAQASGVSVGTPQGPSSSLGDEEPVFHIIRGHQTHTVQFVEIWRCCNGTDVLEKKQAIIFAAKVCDMQTCSTCIEPE